MRSLLTGASGFVGSAIARRLVQGGHEVGCFLRPTGDPWRITEILPFLAQVPVDWGDSIAVSRAVQEFAPDLVIHSGWYGVGGAHRNDVEQLEHNLYMTVELARAARDAGASCFIGFGSQAEYGPCSTAINEEIRTEPTTMYGAVKLAAYHVLRQVFRGSNTRFVWLRLFSAYGPRDNDGWMVPYVIRTLLDGRRPALTAGEQLWDYIYVDDVAEAAVRCADCVGATGALNLASGEARALRSIVEMLRDLVDRSLTLGFGDIPYRSDQVMTLLGDIRRLSGATGWRPRVSIEEGLRRTVEWYRDQR